VPFGCGFLPVSSQAVWRGPGDWRRPCAGPPSQRRSIRSSPLCWAAHPIFLSRHRSCHDISFLLSRQAATRKSDRHVHGWLASRTSVQLLCRRTRCANDARGSWLPAANQRVPSSASLSSQRHHPLAGQAALLCATLPIRASSCGMMFRSGARAGAWSDARTRARSGETSGARTGARPGTRPGAATPVTAGAGAA